MNFIVDPIKLLFASVKANPFMRFALAVGGLFALIAIAKIFQLNVLSGGLAVGALIIIMVVLIVVAGLTQSGTSRYKAEGLFFLRFCIAMFCLFSLASFSGLFFKKPVDLSKLITDSISPTFEQKIIFLNPDGTGWKHDGKVELTYHDAHMEPKDIDDGAIKELRLLNGYNGKPVTMELQTEGWVFGNMTKVFTIVPDGEPLRITIVKEIMIRTFKGTITSDKLVDKEKTLREIGNVRIIYDNGKGYIREFHSNDNGYYEFSIPDTAYNENIKFRFCAIGYKDLLRTLQYGNPEDILLTNKLK